MKKIIIALLFIIIFSAVAYGAEFTDLKQDHWAYSYVSRLVDYGIISGYEDNTFKPSNPITRAEFAKIIVLSLDLSGVEDKVFTDIDEHWAKVYIDIIGNHFYNLEKSNAEIKDQWFYDRQGITINKKLFKPDEYITRADAVYAIIDSLGLSNEQINISEIGEYSDYIEEWAKNSACIAKKNGFIKGDENGNFNAHNSLTRAEVATMVCNIIDKLSLDVSAETPRLVELVNPSPTFSRTSGYPQASNYNIKFNDVILSADIDVLDDNGKSHLLSAMHGGDSYYLTLSLRPAERYRIVCKNIVAVTKGSTKPNKEYTITTFTTVDEKIDIDNSKEFNIEVTRIPGEDKLKVTYTGHLAENNAIRPAGMCIKEYNKPGYGGRVYEIRDNTIDLSSAYSLMDSYGIPRYNKTVLYDYSIIGPADDISQKYITIENKSFEYFIEGQYDNDEDGKYVNLDSLILKGVSSGFPGIEYGLYDMKIEFSDNISSIEADVINSSNESVMISKYNSKNNLTITTSRTPGKYTLLLKNYVGEDGKKTKPDLVYSYPFEITGTTSTYTSNANDPLEVELDIKQPVEIYSTITPKFNKALKPQQVVYMKITTDYYTGSKQMYKYINNFWGILDSAKTRGEYLYGQTIKVTITVMEGKETVVEKTFDVYIPEYLEEEAKNHGI